MTRVLQYNASNPGRIVVADSAGNGDYTTIQAAINYAQTKVPSITNQYLVLIAPGEYSEVVTLYDYIHLSGMGYNRGVRIKPSAGSAIGDIAECYVSNLCIASVNDPLLASGYYAAGKTCVFHNVLIDEDDAEIDVLEMNSGTVILDQCRWKFGGEIVLAVGTLKIRDSFLEHYHASGGAATEHTIAVSASTTLEIIRSSIYNTAPNGEAVRFTGAPTSVKLLHSIFKKSAGATYSLNANVAISITMSRCIINAAMHANITPSGTNDTDTSI